MVKDVIVNLGVAKNGSVVGNYAASVAAALQAHLTGVAFIYDPIVPISDGGYIPADVVETQRADNEAAAESAVKNFTQQLIVPGFQPSRCRLTLRSAGSNTCAATRRDHRQHSQPLCV
jgi:hypothetical protein